MQTNDGPCSAHASPSSPAASESRSTASGPRTRTSPGPTALPTVSSPCSESSTTPLATLTRFGGIRYFLCSFGCSLVAPYSGAVIKLDVFWCDPGWAVILPWRVVHHHYFTACGKLEQHTRALLISVCTSAVFCSHLPYVRRELNSGFSSAELFCVLVCFHLIARSTSRARKRV